MKNVISILFLALLLPPANGQKYITKTGHIVFYSHTPMEDIKADNNQVASVVDLSTGEIVFQVLVKSFKFDRALMEEHFNENYMESDKYPRATFKGKITSPALTELSSEGKHEVTLEGEMTIHNITNKINIKGTIETGKNTIVANSMFNVNPADYKIEIPSVVREKIAKTMEVTADLHYSPVETK